MGLLARIGAGFADIAGMIWRHVRIGCTTELLQVELALILACVLVDGYRFTEYGLCLTAPFRLTLTGTGALQAAAAVFILFLVAAPLTAGIFRVVISMPMRSGHKHRTALGACGSLFGSGGRGHSHMEFEGAGRIERTYIGR